MSLKGCWSATSTGAYNVHQGLHQRCWTHLLRGHPPTEGEIPGGIRGWPNGPNRCGKYMITLRPIPAPARACRNGAARPAGEATTAVPRAAIGHLQASLGQRRPHEGAVPAGGTLLAELFTFVADPRAKADNNAAERSLRPAVVSRKISGGTRSPEGSTTKSVLASLFGTWRLRGPQPLPCPELYPLPTPIRSSLNSYTT